MIIFPMIMRLVSLGRHQSHDHQRGEPRRTRWSWRSGCSDDQIPMITTQPSGAVGRPAVGCVARV